jgi:hypothetical protein
MPPFMTLPPNIQPRRGITAGLPAYCAGSFAYGQSPGKFFVTSVAVAANVVTLGVKQTEGQAPIVGNLITVMGTVAGGAPVNVTRVALASVTLNASGVGTLTYAATTGNIATTPDGGQATVDVAEVAENIAVAKLQQFALDPTAGYGLTWSYSCPTNPATLSIQLEAAINDNDAEYAIVGTAVTTVTGATTIGTVPELSRFVRLNTTINTGGGTMVAKIYQSASK